MARNGDERTNYSVRLNGMSRIGLMLQALGITFLFTTLVTKWDPLTIISFVAMVAGEIIIINSLCHHGCDIRGERI